MESPHKDDKQWFDDNLGTDFQRSFINFSAEISNFQNLDRQIFCEKPSYPYPNQEYEHGEDLNLELRVDDVPYWLIEDIFYSDFLSISIQYS